MNIFKNMSIILGSVAFSIAYAAEPSPAPNTQTTTTTTTTTTQTSAETTQQPSNTGSGIVIGETYQQYMERTGGKQQSNAQPTQ